MKITIEIYILVGILLIAIFISLINSTSTVLPYSKIKNLYKYEGFKENVLDNDISNSKNKEDDDKKNAKSVTFDESSLGSDNKDTAFEKKPISDKTSSTASTDKTSSTAIIDKTSSIASTDKTSSTASIDKTNDKSKNSNDKEGMQSINPSPINTKSTLDMYSYADGSYSCTPSPYSNSKGYLCMNEEQTKLLYTRGGNQTGGDMNVSPS